MCLSIGEISRRSWNLESRPRTVLLRQGSADAPPTLALLRAAGSLPDLFWSAGLASPSGPVLGDASPTNPNGEIGVFIRSNGVADFVKRGYLRQT
jgi:hypothetical protein